MHTGTYLQEFAILFCIRETPSSIIVNESDNMTENVCCLTQTLTLALGHTRYK
jgi:hypothetical protein